MKTYHFSVHFDGCEITHHSEFETAFINPFDIKEKAKKTLDTKLKEWGFLPTDLNRFEVYDEERKIIFEWKKQ